MSGHRLEGRTHNFRAFLGQFLPIWPMLLLFGDPVQCSPVTTFCLVPAGGGYRKSSCPQKGIALYPCIATIVTPIAVYTLTTHTPLIKGVEVHLLN